MSTKEKNSFLSLFIIQQFLIFVEQENQEWEHRFLFLPPLQRVFDHLRIYLKFLENQELSIN